MRTQTSTLLLLLAATFAVLSIPPVEEPQLNHSEIPLQRLILREGRLCRPSQNHAYSGFAIERFSNGALKSRSEISKGKLHGVSKGYHPNGTLQIREHFVRGNSHGVRTKWRADASRESQAQIEKGHLHGSFHRWNEQGELIEDLNFKHGHPNGPQFVRTQELEYDQTSH